MLYTIEMVKTIKEAKVPDTRHVAKQKLKKFRGDSISRSDIFTHSLTGSYFIKIITIVDISLN